jgi:uncharacterized membrane protein YqjE
MGDSRLKSLSTFFDVSLALVFFRIVEYLPAFEGTHWTQLPHGLISLLASEPVNLSRVGFGLILIAYIWVRKNTLLSMVKESNATFETLSLASLTFIMVFMYALIADPTYVGGSSTLLLQSISYLLASLFGFWALRYAIHAGCTRPELRSSTEQLARVDLSNPLTAIIATALSWSGLLVWTLSWFVFMPIFSLLLGRRRART